MEMMMMMMIIHAKAVSGMAGFQIHTNQIFLSM